jgi:formylglycine-generating enzyme required for sulfatase activity
MMAMVVGSSPNAGAAVTYDTVTVGNLGNANDTIGGGYGSVAYEYQIGKYEVTIGQYAEFLNAVATTDRYSLFNPGMGTNPNIAGITQSGSSGSWSYSVMTNQGFSGDRPITYVSWFDAARFANWMTNGQGAGSTETGAYTLNNAVSGTALPRNFTVSNPAATYYIPSENEWYKAAYFSPVKSGTVGYFLYATQSDSPPGNVIGPEVNQANYFTNNVYSQTQSWYSPDDNYLSDRGSFSDSSSFYGTYDQSGNVGEWTDRSGSPLTIRGGSWRDDQAGKLSSANRQSRTPTSEEFTSGFRLALLPSGTTPPPPPPPPEIVIEVAPGTTRTHPRDKALYGEIDFGSVAVRKTGGGVFVISDTTSRTGPTTVQQGTLVLAHSEALLKSRIVLAGGTVAVSAALQTTVAGFDFSSSGVVDVTSGSVTVTNGLSATELVSQILTGRGDGSWTGSSGITSSIAAADAALGQPRAVGWLDNGDGSVSFAYAAHGDTNLDWQVDVLDAANLLAGGKFNTGGPATWGQGDFNYDGVVDILDMAGFISTGLYDQGTYNVLPGANGAAVAVPEPSGMGSLTALFGLAGWLCSRRHPA